MPQELFIPKKRQKEGGTYFDDLLGKKPPTDEELNSMAMRKEINSRPGTNVYVPRETLRRMQEVIALWQRYEQVSPSLLVLVDDTIQPGTVEVRYPV